MVKLLKRWVSLLLVCLMLVSLIPFNVLAEEQQALEPFPKETVETTAINGSTPGGDNQNDAAEAQAVQPVITEPKAEVINSQSLSAEESITTAETEDLTVTLNADKTSSQNRNTTVVFTATASGGVAPYSYEFLLDGKTVVSTANTASIELTEAGSHSIEVVVTDATADNAETASATSNFVIKDNPLVTLTTVPDVTANHYVKEEVTLQAVIDGGTSPLNCRFYYQLGSATKVEIKNPIVDDHRAQVSFTPDKAGSYTLSVEIIDSNLLKTNAKINLTVLALVSAKSFTVDKPSGQNVGTTIKLTANGSGGKVPYTYEFEYQLNSEPAVTIDDEKLPSANTVEFTPEIPGVYTFIVTIKDNEGLEDENTKTVEKTIDNYRVVNGPVIEDFTATNKSDPEKPTYVKDPILLQVDLAEGTGTVADSVKYTYTIKNGSKTIKTVTQPGDTYEFIPDSPGTYNFTVKAVDSDNLSATKTTSLVVLNTVAVTLKADKPSGQSIHTNINLTAAASGGQAPYSYEFKYEYLGETKVMQYPSQSKTATFVIDDPEKIGLYTFRVLVTDANGLQLGQDGKLLDPASAEIIDYRITNPPVIDSFTADPVKGSAVYAGDKITLKAKVIEDTGEKNPLDYQFYVNGKLLTAIDADLTTLGTCIYTPSTAGNYTFEVAVSDGQTTVKQKITNYKVIAGVEVTSLTPDKPTGLIVGDTIKLTAAGKGGVAPYSYAFYYKIDDKDGGVIQAKTAIIPVDSKLKTIDYKLIKDGIYTFYVVITDKNEGDYSENEVAKKIVVTVTDPPIVDSLEVTDSADAKVTSSYAGDAITLTATPADVTATLTYTFSYKVGTKTTIIVEKDADGTVEFIPPGPGSYTFYVSAYDDTSKLTSPPVSVTKFTVLKSFVVKSLKTSKSSGQNINTAIKLTATAEGGKAPYKYSFYQKLKTSETDTIEDAEYDDCKIIEGSSLNNTSYTPDKDGTYIFMVVITDANGTETKPYPIDFEVTNPFIVTLKPDKPSQSVYQEDTVTLTAEVDKGTDDRKLDYLFYWKMGAETGECVLDAKVPNKPQTATFKPDVPGTYTLFVDVIDADGTLKTAKIGSYKVLGSLTVDSLVVDKVAPQNIGTTIRLTANGSGGKAPYKYQFYYKFVALADDGVDVTEWKAIGTKTTSKSINYRLTTAGTYQFGVQLIDANTKETAKPDPNTIYEDYVVVDKPIITSFTANPSLKQYVEEPIKLTAAARGGSGTYTYVFSYVDSEGVTIEKEIKEVGSSATVTFKDAEAITAAGTYQFNLTVTDTKNDDPDTKTAEKTINYTIVSKPSIKSFNPDKTAIKTGTSVKLTAAGQYGIGTYQYKFWVKKDGDAEPKMIRSFSSTPTCTYRPPTAGTYTFYVDIKDSKLTTSGLEAESKTVEVIVTD